MSFLPTVHGFDEYSGVLYHLNALEEPENVDYPKDPAVSGRNSDRVTYFTPGPLTKSTKQKTLDGAK